VIHRHAAERPAMLLMVAGFPAYPIAASFGAEIWIAAAAGALASLGVCRAYQVAPVRKAASQVSPDILVFVWGIFVVVHGLRAADVADQLRALHDSAPRRERGPARHGRHRVGSRLGRDRQPPDVDPQDARPRSRARPAPLLVVLVGGDIGPRLLPVGSLAGLLWIDLRRSGVEVGVGPVLRLGTLVVLPTLAASLAMLWLLRP
jgi:arsenical pump membrane protein